MAHRFYAGKAAQWDGQGADLEVLGSEANVMAGSAQLGKNVFTRSFENFFNGTVVPYWAGI